MSAWQACTGSRTPALADIGNAISGLPPCAPVPGHARLRPRLWARLLLACALLLLAACGSAQTPAADAPNVSTAPPPPAANATIAERELPQQQAQPTPTAAVARPGADGMIPAAGQQDARPPAPAAQTAPAALAPCWRPLAARLAADGLSGPRVDALLATLAPVPTQSPMGRKIRELYQRRFFPKPPSGKAAPRYYKGVVTPANARLCQEFIAAHRQAFERAQARYGVPPAIAASLLFVETRLGTVLGDVPDNAFYTLASMAVSTTPGDISQWLPRLPGYEQHLPWLDETLRKRSDWAYAETRALVEHMLRDQIAPHALPGSIYGAVGLCQFMPSNISTYGADGDGDGRVDLFSVPDAVASLAHYLAKHGWRAGLSRERQHALLMTYNHSKTYANTILALSDLVAGTPAQPKAQRGEQRVAQAATAGAASGAGTMRAARAGS